MLLETETNEYVDCLDCMGENAACEWSGWSEWSDCTETCGTGERVRSRMLPESGVDPVLECGIEDSRGVETEFCNTEGCEEVIGDDDTGSGDKSREKSDKKSDEKSGEKSGEKTDEKTEIVENSGEKSDETATSSGQGVVVVISDQLTNSTTVVADDQIFTQTHQNSVRSSITEASGNSQPESGSSDSCCTEFQNAVCQACLNGLELCDYCEHNYLATETGREYSAFKKLIDLDSIFFRKFWKLNFTALYIPGCETCPLIEITINNLLFQTTQNPESEGNELLDPTNIQPTTILESLENMDDRFTTTDSMGVVIGSVVNTVNFDTGDKVKTTDTVKTEFEDDNKLESTALPIAKIESTKGYMTSMVEYRVVL